MLSAALQAQIKRIQIKARHLASDLLAGEYASAFKGRGMEFDELREYLPGDDVRAMDWNVTARTGVPHVKVFREERELSMLLIVDVSASQRFSSGFPSKQEIAAEVAAILAFVAIRNQDKVGLLLFSDHVEKYIPPKKGRAHIWNLIRLVLTFEAKGSSTDMAGALDYAMRVSRGRPMCFLISDFWARSYMDRLRQLARRHEVVAIQIRDPLEHALKPCGLVRFRDLESGEELVVDTSHPEVLAALQQRAQAKGQDLAKQLKQAGIDLLSLNTADDLARRLLGYFMQRERRMLR